MQPQQIAESMVPQPFLPGAATSTGQGPAGFFLSLLGESLAGWTACSGEDMPQPEHRAQAQPEGEQVEAASPLPSGLMVAAVALQPPVLTPQAAPDQLAESRLAATANGALPMASASARAETSSNGAMLPASQPQAAPTASDASPDTGPAPASLHTQPGLATGGDFLGTSPQPPAEAQAVTRSVVNPPPPAGVTQPRQVAAPPQPAPAGEVAVNEQTLSGVAASLPADVSAGSHSLSFPAPPSHAPNADGGQPARLSDTGGAPSPAASTVAGHEVIIEHSISSSTPSPSAAGGRLAAAYATLRGADPGLTALTARPELPSAVIPPATGGQAPIPSAMDERIANLALPKRPATLGNGSPPEAATPMPKRPWPQAPVASPGPATSPTAPVTADSAALSPNAGLGQPQSGRAQASGPRLVITEEQVASRMAPPRFAAAPITDQAPRIAAEAAASVGTPAVAGPDRALPGETFVGVGNVGAGQTHDPARPASDTISQAHELPAGQPRSVPASASATPGAGIPSAAPQAAAAGEQGAAPGPPPDAVRAGTQAAPRVAAGHDQAPAQIVGKQLLHQPASLREAIPERYFEHKQWGLIAPEPAPRPFAGGREQPEQVARPERAEARAAAPRANTEAPVRPISERPAPSEQADRAAPVASAVAGGTVAEPAPEAAVRIPPARLQSGIAEQAQATPATLPAAGTEPSTPQGAAAPSDPAPAAATRIMDHIEIIRQLSSAVRAGLRAGNSEIVLRLDPPALGSVRLVVQRQEAVLHATLQVGHGEVRDLLQRHLGELRGALAAGGLEVGNCNIELGAHGQPGHLSQHAGEQAPPHTHHLRGHTAPRPAAPAAPETRRLSQRPLGLDYLA